MKKQKPHARLYSCIRQQIALEDSVQAVLPGSEAASPLTEQKSTAFWRNTPLFNFLLDSTIFSLLCKRTKAIFL
jgi:hypothetical protein